MDALLDADTTWFYLINREATNALFDAFFPWITRLKNFAVPLGLLVVWLLVRGGRRGRLCLLAIGLSVGITDPLTVRVLKPSIDRERPCIALEDTRLLASRKASPSFPSAHAVNSAVVATLFGVFYRRSLWFGVPLAFLIGVSRVYIGVHYPFDVMAGWVLGVSLGLLVAAAMWRAGRHVEALRWP